MAQISKELQQSIANKAIVLDIHPAFLLSAIQLIVTEKLRGEKIIEDFMTFEAMEMEFYKGIADQMNKQSRELTNEEYSSIAKSPFVGARLSYMSGNDGIREHHLKALEVGQKYMKSLLEKYDAPALVSIIINQCEPEINKMYSEIR